MEKLKKWNIKLNSYKIKSGHLRLHPAVSTLGEKKKTVCGWLEWWFHWSGSCQVDCQIHFLWIFLCWKCLWGAPRCAGESGTCSQVDSTQLCPSGEKFQWHRGKAPSLIPSQPWQGVQTAHTDCVRATKRNPATKCASMKLINPASVPAETGKNSYQKIKSLATIYPTGVFFWR